MQILLFEALALLISRNHNSHPNLSQRRVRVTIIRRPHFSESMTPCFINRSIDYAGFNPVLALF